MGVIVILFFFFTLARHDFFLGHDFYFLINWVIGFFFFVCHFFLLIGHHFMEVYVLIGHHFILPLFHPPIVFYLLTFPPLQLKEPLNFAMQLRFCNW